VLAPQHAPKVCPGGNGIFFPMIIHDGQIVGTWKREIKTQSVVIRPVLFEGAIDHDAFTIAAQRYGTFVGSTTIVL
jgi:hypothetical protein